MKKNSVIFTRKNKNVLVAAVLAALFSPLVVADGTPMDSREMTTAVRNLANAHGGNAPISTARALPASDSASNVLFSSAPRVARVDQALEYARSAYIEGKSAKPIVAADGRVLYPFQSDVYPQIVCSTLRACSIELQAGEVVIATVVGDTARWHIQVIEGANPQQVIIKPTEPNIDTNLSIVTDRRTYYADIASRETHYVPRIGWFYPNEMVAEYREGLRAQQKVAEQTISQVSPTDLDFDYKIAGLGSFKPDQVFNDGRQTFIRLPKSNHDMPGVVAVREGETALINARVRDGYLIVDGVHAEYALIAGREMVHITRGNQPVTINSRTSAGSEADRKRATGFFARSAANSERNQSRKSCDPHNDRFDWWNCHTN